MDPFEKRKNYPIKTPAADQKPNLSITQKKNMLNSRQRLAQQLLTKEKEPENQAPEEPRPESSVPPKFKRPFVKTENDLNVPNITEIIKKDNNYIPNDNQYNDDNNENYKIKKTDFNQNKKVINYESVNNISSINETENVEKSNQKKSESDHNFSKEFDSDQYLSEKFEKKNSDEVKDVSNKFGLIGGIIGKSNDLFENATSQLISFLGNIAGNLNNEEENQKPDHDQPNMKENYNLNDNNWDNDVNKYHNKGNNVYSYVKEAQKPNLFDFDNSSDKKISNQLSAIPVNVQTDILYENYELNKHSLPKGNPILIRNNTETENAKLNKKISETKTDYYNKKEESDNESSNKQHEIMRNRIEILEKEVTHLRNIINDYKKKEIENNENIQNLEITKLKNIIKWKNDENQLLGNEIKELKSHIKLLQDKISIFFNEDKDNKSSFDNQKNSMNVVQKEKLKEIDIKKNDYSDGDSKEIIDKVNQLKSEEKCEPRTEKERKELEENKDKEETIETLDHPKEIKNLKQEKNPNKRTIPIKNNPPPFKILNKDIFGFANQNAFYDSIESNKPQKTTELFD